MPNGGATAHRTASHQPPGIDARQARRYRWAWRLTWILPLVGLLAAALWAAGTADTWRVALGRFAGLALIAAAAMAVGGLLGFLFGVPKVLSETPVTDSGQPPADRTTSGGSDGSSGTTTGAAGGTATAPVTTGVTYAVRGSGGIGHNTNLEQISDWLTKILVGVGLVQLGSLPGAFGRLVRILRDDFAVPASGHVIGSVLIFFAVSGFLVAYLLTRLVLTGAFRAVDDPHGAGEEADDDPDQH